MTKLFNKTEAKGNRKALRNNMVKAEIVLWSKLKGHQLLGLKFRRQYSVDRYILDFYCPELKLGIELDGATHENSSGYDYQRQSYIENAGIKILRFNNQDIYHHLDLVLEAIANYKNHPVPSAGHPSLLRRG
jgi:very-short-patch-repair endonuclease